MKPHEPTLTWRLCRLVLFRGSYSRFDPTPPAHLREQQEAKLSLRLVD